MRAMRCFLRLAWLVSVAVAPAVAQGLVVEGAVFVEPDAPAMVVRDYRGAGGALDRHMGRPGAWYALLFVPLAPRMPVELVLWPQPRRHTLRLTALDLPPDHAPSMAVRLPLQSGGPIDRSRAATQVSRFMLPAASAAEGVYLLLEQWRADGAPPPPLWLRVHWGVAPAPLRSPWNSARIGPLEAPLSPLSQARLDQPVLELPLWGVRGPSGYWTEPAR